MAFGEKLANSKDAEKNFYIAELHLDLESWPRFYGNRLLFDRYFPLANHESTVAFIHFYIYKGQADLSLLGAGEYFSAHMKSWSDSYAYGSVSLLDYGDQECGVRALEVDMLKVPRYCLSWYGTNRDNSPFTP